MVEKTNSIVIEDKEGIVPFVGLNSKYKRKITVNGFCNFLNKSELKSACCIDCWAGFHGENAIERLELQSGDYIVAGQANNYISIVNYGVILRVKEFLYKE